MPHKYFEKCVNSESFMTLFERIEKKLRFGAKNSKTQEKYSKLEEKLKLWEDLSSPSLQTDDKKNAWVRGLYGINLVPALVMPHFVLFF